MEREQSNEADYNDDEDVYDLGYTDDEIRREYTHWGYKLDEEKKIKRYGKRPWHWDGSAPTGNRDYSAFRKKHTYQDQEGVLYVNNNINGHNVLSYRIPIKLTREANAGTRAQPQHPEPGQIKTLVHQRLQQRIVIHVVAVTTGTGRTAQRRATGNVEYSVV